MADHNNKKQDAADGRVSLRCRCHGNIVVFVTQLNRHTTHLWRKRCVLKLHFNPSIGEKRKYTVTLAGNWRSWILETVVNCVRPGNSTTFYF